MAYDYTNGDGIAALIITEPNGATEPLSILDNAIRQVKAYLADPIEGPDAKIEALARPIRVIVTHSTTPQVIDESDGAVTVAFNDVALDSGSDFNPATYLFTAPEDGLYLIICQVTLNKSGGTAAADIVHKLELMVGGVTGAETYLWRDSNDAQPVDMQISRMFNLSAGQTISARYSITVSGGTLEMTLATDPRSTIFQATRFALS
jgi:hypothetical protein